MLIGSNWIAPFFFNSIFPANREKCLVWKFTNSQHLNQNSVFSRCFGGLNILSAVNFFHVTSFCSIINLFLPFRSILLSFVDILQTTQLNFLSKFWSTIIMAVKLAFVATFTAIVAAIRAAWNFYTIVVNYILVVQILHLFLMSVGPNVLKKHWQAPKLLRLQNLIKTGINDDFFNNFDYDRVRTGTRS